MSYGNPIKLTGLTTREAIADALYRVLSGCDENDLDLFKSGMTSDIHLNMAGQDMSGIEEVIKGTFNTIGPMDTTHMVNSVRIDVKDDASTTAKMTANSLAQHYPAGMGATESEKRLLGGSKHALQVVKDEKDGSWRIKDWDMKIVWHEGDFSVMTPPS